MFFLFSVSEHHRHKDAATLRLYQASLAGDLVAMASMLAEGAEVNGSIGEEEGRTPLIGAAIGVSRHKEDEILLKTPFIDYYLSITLLTPNRHHHRCY